MTIDHWFTPKTYGYGAAPKGWKGWAAILGFIAAQFAATIVLIGVGGTAIEAWRIAVWIAVTAALTIGFILLTRAKTDGEWHWRWPKQ